jgi:hypothetical protein
MISRGEPELADATEYAWKYFRFKSNIERLFVELKLPEIMSNLL